MFYYNYFFNILILSHMPNNEILKELKYLINIGINEFVDDKPQKYYTPSEEKSDLPNQTEYTKLENIENLDDLKTAVINFQDCKLKFSAKNTVFSDGNPKSNIMLIGEAPGADEDEMGKPFVGKAGQLLNKMLAAINLNRENVYITNIVPWRPPGNRQPTNDEILMCVPFVQRHIELINPKVLVLLGGTATKALLLSDAGIMRLQGKWHQYSSYGLASPIATRPVFHPAFLLRSPGYKKNAWEDLKEIKLKLGN